MLANFATESTHLQLDMEVERHPLFRDNRLQGTLCQLPRDFEPGYMASFWQVATCICTLFVYMYV